VIPTTNRSYSVHISHRLVFISDKAFVFFEVVTGYFMLKGKGKGHPRNDHEGPE